RNEAGYAGHAGLFRRSRRNGGVEGDVELVAVQEQRRLGRNHRIDGDLRGVDVARAFLHGAADFHGEILEGTVFAVLREDGQPELQRGVELLRRVVRQKVRDLGEEVSGDKVRSTDLVHEEAAQ